MYSPQMFEKLTLAMPLNEDVLVSGIGVTNPLTDWERNKHSQWVGGCHCTDGQSKDVEKWTSFCSLVGVSVQWVFECDYEWQCPQKRKGRTLVIWHWGNQENTCQKILLNFILVTMLPTELFAKLTWNQSLASVSICPKDQAPQTTVCLDLEIPA